MKKECTNCVYYKDSKCSKSKKNGYFNCQTYKAIPISELTKEYDRAGTRTKAAAKEIDNLSREIGKAEAATNRHQRGVGGYADQLGNLGGKFGNVISGLQNTGKSMWALVANPIGAFIALVVGAFAGLIAIFKSTDSGANALKGAFEGLQNVMDIIVDRAEKLLKLDFRGAFGGAGKAIKEAAAAGQETGMHTLRIFLLKEHA